MDLCPFNPANNFLFAHAECNAANKDRLAAYNHLKRRCRRNIELRDEFALANTWMMLQRDCRDHVKNANDRDKNGEKELPHRSIKSMSNPKFFTKALRITAAVLAMIAQIIVACMG